MASGVLGVAFGVLTVAWPPAVSEDRWSYPFPAGVQLGVGLLLAVTHVLTLVGVLALGRRLRDRFGRPARAGVLVAAAGLGLLGVCELLSGFLGDASIDSGSAVALSSGYGVASLVCIAGSIAAGVGVVRSGWSTPVARWALLASGLVLLLLVTPANVAGSLVVRMAALSLWSLLFVPLGLALLRDERRDAST